MYIQLCACYILRHELTVMLFLTYAFKERSAMRTLVPILKKLPAKATRQEPPSQASKRWLKKVTATPQECQASKRWLKEVTAVCCTASKKEQQHPDPRAAQIRLNETLGVPSTWIM